MIGLPAGADLISPSRKLVNKGVLAVWVNELNRRRNLFFVLMSDMLIITKRKQNKRAMHVLQVFPLMQIQTCKPVGSKNFQIFFGQTGRNFLDCETQTTADRDNWARFLNQGTASCFIQDLEKL